MISCLVSRVHVHMPGCEPLCIYFRYCSVMIHPHHAGTHLIINVALGARRRGFLPLKWKVDPWIPLQWELVQTGAVTLLALRDRADGVTMTRAWMPLGSRRVYKEPAVFPDTLLLRGSSSDSSL